MKIRIDNKEIIVTDSNKNIVEIGDENGITIVAPCFRNKKQNGCCNACLIEVDGNQKYACSTKPHEGMDIIYNREDLSEMRKEKLAKYSDAIKNNDSSSNQCGCNDSTQFKTESTSCGCSDSSCCS